MANVGLTITCMAMLSSLGASLPARRFENWIAHENGRNISFGGYKADVKTVSELYFTQKVDHFNGQDTATFQQRFFVEESYWSKKDDAPVFLCVGGEGPPLDETVLSSSVHCNDMVELGQQRGALLLALEHRYYGPSMPSPGDYSTQNLRYLSSEQALEDLAAFQALMVSQYNLQKTNKWVTWGGSYPGMMAAMSRLKYPNLIHACVSSSSPLQATLDFPGYNNVVAKSMSNPIVGGSDNCLSVISEGHSYIGELLKSADGRKELESTFNVCQPGALEDSKNQEQFAGDGVVYFDVQGNDPACTGRYCSIDKVCNFLVKDISFPVSGEVAMKRLADFRVAQSGSSCMPVSWDASIRAISSPKNPERSWLYQTCSEWGFYQTCEFGSQCPYTQGLHNVTSDLEICSAAFGLSADQVSSAILATNVRYGGAVNFQGSRIMFPNGEVDPWSAGGVLVAPENSVEEVPLWVEGASHHFWTHPSLETDSAQVNAARQAIWNQVDSWLAER